MEAITLDEIREATDGVFEKWENEAERLELPEPAVIWKDKLAAADAAKLPEQRSLLLFEMRTEQVRTMGFQCVESRALCEMMMGQRPTTAAHSRTDLPRQVYEWVLNHHTGDIYGAQQNWGSHPIDFAYEDYLNGWYAPPFQKKEIWRCRFGKLPAFKRKIPYGVLLRINELKEAKIFNCFNIIAPVECWEQGRLDIDPVVVGTIWEMPPANEKGEMTAGLVEHYFVAQW